MFVQKSKRLLFSVVAVFVLFTPELFAQAGMWDFFEINAQYRGGVKKGFEEMGCALAFYTTTSEGKQVILHACVKHPQKKGAFYSFRVNLIYDETAAGITTKKEIYSWFDGFEPEHQRQIKDMILFLALIRSGAYSEAAGTPVKVNGTVLSVNAKFLGGGKRHECFTTRSGNPVLEGKFFSSADPAKKLSLNKFHLRREKISVSFVSVPVGKLKEKYQTKVPYNQVVFGK